MAKNMPKNKAKASNLTVDVATTEASNTSLEKPTKAMQKAAVVADAKTAESKKSKKTAKKSPDKKPNIFKRMWKGLKGVFSELKKVSWPKGKDVAKSTSVVLIVVVLFFAVLFGIDYVLTGLMNLVVQGEWVSFIG